MVSPAPRPHSRSLRPLGAALLAALASCSSLGSLWQSANNDSMLGRIAPDLVGKRWAGGAQAPATTEYTGHHTVLVFFDPSASSSKDVMKDVSTLAAEYRPQGVAFYGLTDADGERLSAFTDDQPVGFPVLTEASADRRNFGIKKLYKPEIFVVDPYQRVVSEGLDDAERILRRRE